MMQNTLGEWKSVVTRVYARRNWINYQLGVKAVRALGYPEFYGPPGSATILDGYAGAGVFSACLYNEIKPQKHVLLEPLASYTKFLSQLAATTPGVEVSQGDPYRWGTFTKLMSDGIVDPVKEQWAVPRTQINNRLLYTANLTHNQGEQLVAQYLNCISNQSWLQRFGRVRLLLWMRAATAEKLLAGPGEKFRHRLGAQRESCCDARLVFHKSTMSPEKRAATRDAYPAMLEEPLLEYSSPKDLKQDFSSRIVGQLSLVELTPHEHQVEHIDEFEYVLRMLFVLSGTPLKQGLDSLGPGAAEDLGPQLADLLHLKPTQLKKEDFVRITDAFWRWPFKPEILMDFYEESSALGMGSTDGARM